MNKLSLERAQQINQQSVDRSDMFYWQTDRPMTMEECAIIFGQSRQNVDNNVMQTAITQAIGTTEEYRGVTVEKVEGGEQYTVGSVNINRNFVLSNGREVVGRFHPRGIKNGYFSVETAAAKLALSHGVPAANPIAVRYAEDNQDMDFVVFEKVQGSNMKHWLVAHPEDEAKLVTEAGKLMARIHQIKVKGYGFFDNSLAHNTGELKGIHNSYKDHLLAALPQNLTEIKDAGYISQAQAEKITRLLQETDLIDCQDPRLIHNDLADWNIMVDETAGLVAIDWDEAHAGDPIADIACWSLFFPTKRLAILLDGYKQITDLPDNFEEKLHIYRLRYLVSKLTLRHKKYLYDKSPIMQDLVRVGHEALAEESAYFNLV